MDAEFAAATPAPGVLDKVLAAQRRRMVEAFARFREGGPGDTVLEVSIAPAPGTERAFGPEGLPDRTGVHSCLLAAAPLRRAPQAADQKGKQVADSRHLPYADGEFEWVYCSEVIEHVGSFERQYELLKELLRVSRKGIFVGTPNLWHPIEFNTRLPLLHWLPDAWWRRILKWSGRSAWAPEAVLNPLDVNDLKQLTSLLPCSPKSDIGHLRVGGVKAHFFLQIRKGQTARADKKAATAAAAAA